MTLTINSELLFNATVTAGSTINEGETATIELTGKTTETLNYVFRVAPKLYGSKTVDGVLTEVELGTFVISDDPKTATLEITLSAEYSNVRIKGAAIRDDATSWTSIDTSALYNCEATSNVYCLPTNINMSVTIKLKANEGCGFYSSPYFYYTKKDATTETRLAVSSEGYFAELAERTVSIPANSSNYRLVKGAGLLNVPFNTDQLSNASVTSENPLAVSVRTSKTITVKSDTGYIFTEKPVVKSYVINEYTEGVTVKNYALNISENGKTATRTFLQDTFFNGITEIDIVGTAVSTEPEPTDPQVPFNTEISHCHGTGIPENVNANTPLNIIIYTDSGYIFNEFPVIKIFNASGSVKKTYTFKDNPPYIGKATFTGYLTDLDTENDTVTLIATAVEKVSDVRTDLELAEVNDCVVEGAPSKIGPSDQLNITITANLGFKFVKIPYILYADEWGQEHNAYFTLNDDKTVATFNGTIPDISNSMIAYLYATADISEIYGRYGSVNIYQVTDEQLDEFCEKRFNFVGSFGDLLRVDLGNFVNRIRRVFFPIGTTVPTKIVCGDYNSGVDAQAVKNDIQTLDFGDVQLPEHNEDVTDYTTTQIKIFLPFVGIVDIDNRYIGKTVSLVYTVNVVTGGGVAKLSCEGNTFALYPCEPSNEIMFKTNDQYATLVSADFNSQFLFGFTPYVIMYWNESHNEKYVNNDCLRGVIGSYSGFIKFSEVTDINSGQITADEKNLLVRTLNSGVFIETEDAE